MNDPDTMATAVWVGEGGSDELALARRAVESRLETIVIGRPMPGRSYRDQPSSDRTVAAGLEPQLSELGGRQPLVVCLSADVPRRPLHETALRLSRRWPLCRFVAVGSSLCEGRRRSGPPLPGVEEIPWHDLPGRLEGWLEDFRSGRPGWLGQPATARREDRLLEGIRQRPLSVDDESQRRSIAVAAARQESCDGFVDLLAAFGSPACQAAVGRPRMETTADVLLWECPESVAAELPWLGIFAAHRPGTDIVMLESFPRGDRAVEAIRAGAAWVLGRPTPAEVLFGTLLRLARGTIGSGLGPAVTAG